MAENNVIISAEEEAKLLKPIDEYVEEIQKKIDALRADGFDKVSDLKKQIAIAKENKNLSATQRDKIIENSKKELENAKKVEAELKKNGVYVSVDARSEKIGYKIRESRLAKVPYMLVVGEKEEADGTVSVRSRFAGDEGVKPIAEFVEQICKEIRTKEIRKEEV